MIRVEIFGILLAEQEYKIVNNTHCASKKTFVSGKCTIN